MGNMRSFQVIDFPSFYPLKRTLIHPSALKELRKLYDTKQLAALLDDALKDLLPHLDKHLEKAREDKRFEQLTNGKGLCSIKIKNKLLKNPRILYCIQDEHVYLLLAFKEKEQGTDYRPYLPTANTRRREIT